MMMSINQLMTSWDGYHTVSWSWKHMLKNVVVQSSICVHHYQDKDKVTAASLVASLQYMSPFSPTYLTFSMFQYIQGCHTYCHSTTVPFSTAPITVMDGFEGEHFT